MEIVKTKVEGVCVFCPKTYGDNRGSFMELWNQKSFLDIGVTDYFVQDNISTSIKGVIRGMHTQVKFPQAKIVSCLHGTIYDVVVDTRLTSPTFGKWHGELLSGENHRQMYIPKGIAHGFLTLEDVMVHMKVTTHYILGDEIGFMWNDESIGIDWPIAPNMELTLADKDLKWPSFSIMMGTLMEMRSNQ